MNHCQKTLQFLFVTLIVIFIIPSCSIAREYSAGIKVGTSLSEFWGKDKLSYATKSKRLLGKTGFIYFSMQINNYFSVQPEFGYVKKGKQIELDYSAYQESSNAVTLSDFVWEESYKLEYFEVPILAKVSIPLPRPLKARCSIYCGPTMDFLFSASKTIHDNGTPLLLDLNDETKKFDAGLSLGLACEVHFYHGALIVDMRASEGFLTFSALSPLEKQISPSSKQADVKNRTAYCLVGYEYEF